MPWDDGQAFARRVLDLIEDDEARATMAAAGRARILDRYSEDAAMQALSAALHRFGPQ